MDIYSKIKEYTDTSPIRFHMPGHGGARLGSYLDEAYCYDVSEIEETDNLYSPSAGGFTEKTLRELSSFYGSASTVISAGGATLCIQGAILAAARKYGIKFILHPSCHISVINALSLVGAEAVYFSDINDIFADIKDSFDGASVIVSSPDYCGRMCDIAAVSAQCREHRCHLIADNSHGAHLIFHENGAYHPLALGADTVIDSLHKTLPSLTGSALLHSMVFNTDELLGCMKVFASTSPSFLISESVGYMYEYMRLHGEQALRELRHNVELCAHEAKKHGFRRIVSDIYDPYRLALTSFNGEYSVYDMRETEAYLKRHNIHPEYASREELVLIPHLTSRDSDFSALSDCLASFAAERPGGRFIPRAYRAGGGIYPVSLSVAVTSPRRTVPTLRARGEISACVKFVYPPGVAIVLPGELLTETKIQMLLENGIDETEIL